jgi:cellulose synthase/poly-beta-1,6-N-acetylglucosamine synthase-like glycosyltransferase
MEVVNFLFKVISWIVFIYLAANTVYLFIIALAGRMVSVKTFKAGGKKSRISVLIPCYREDLIILDTALKAKNHDYPSELFTITVIADKLKSETVEKLRRIPVEIIEVDLDMKSRSLHTALETKYVADADIVMILDADNIMADGCLEKVNAAYQNGAVAIQCHRTAKNKNTAVALLDAISEEININLFRRGPAAIGLSAAPVGSGMAFDGGLIRDIFSGREILENPGEDREVDMQLMRRDIKMEFLDDALVYDEKVASTAVFEKQRVRWLEAQVNHLKRFFDEDMRSAPKTFLYYNKFFQNLLLPRVLTLLVFSLIVFLFILEYFFSIAIFHPAPVYWLSMIGIYAVTLFISIPSSFYNWQTVLALSRVPILMIAMVKAVLQLKKKRSEFIHTPKSFTGNNPGQ